METKNAIKHCKVTAAKHPAEKMSPICSCWCHLLPFDRMRTRSGLCQENIIQRWEKLGKALWYGNWSLLHSPFESFWCNLSRTSQLPNRASHFFLDFIQVTISNPVGPAVSNRYLPNQLLQLTRDWPNQLLRRARVVCLCNSNLARGSSSCEKTETLRNSTVTDRFKK